MTFAVISADHSGGNLIACVDIFCQVEIRIIGEILQADDAVGIIFQIQGNGSFRNADDGSGQDIALVDLLKGSFQFLFVSSILSTCSGASAVSGVTFFSSSLII